ncbi:MAG: hypothetical protein M1819_006284 [Sarea resinae]|nr:MAG: hypothetical protein M1819_006284 [Sarea resinae]
MARILAELATLWPPNNLEVAPVVEPGAKAPSSDKLVIPRADGKPVLITFLRHCGCPFAEKDFQLLREVGTANPSVHCVAVSHSSPAITEKWVNAVGGAGPIEVIVDEERELYARWGLGVSNLWHLMNTPTFTNVTKLGREEGIWNRGEVGGNRWQSSGSFGVAGDGTMRWSKPSTHAGDIPDFHEALKAVQA